MIPVSSIDRYYGIVARYRGLGLRRINPAVNSLLRLNGTCHGSRRATKSSVESRHRHPEPGYRSAVCIQTVSL
jgi:hypothetical protein